jgi:ribonuclease HI
MPKTFHSVQKGRTPGIYLTWAEAKTQVEGFSGAVHKSFKKREEAEAFLKLDGYHGGDARAEGAAERA